jgi:membrane protein implicated in regulation of membrane protease activity
MIDFFNNNQHAFWLSAGFLILLVELGVFGLSSGVLMFTGLSALVTGALMWSGLLPATWLAGSASFGIGSGIIALLLWKPLLKLQTFETPAKDNSSDLVGYRFVLDGPLSPTVPARTRYSGIEWRVELASGSQAERLEPGTLVEVRSLDAGVFRVARADEEPDARR